MMTRKQVAISILDTELVDEIKKLEADTNLSFAELLRLLITTYETVARDKEVEVI